MFGILLPLFGCLPQASQLPPPPHPPASPGLWRFDRYTLPVADWNPQIRVEVTQQAGIHADLYLRHGQPPTLTEWDFRAATPGTSDEEISVHGESSPPLESGAWHIGIWRPQGTSYGINYWLETVPSIHEGMGPETFGDPAEETDGTSFRVWAPHAFTVHVAGPFNGWSGSASPLAPEGDGNWSLDVRHLGHRRGGCLRVPMPPVRPSLAKNPLLPCR